MAKVVYKNSRKKCVKNLDEVLHKLDSWSGDFFKIKDDLGNCITDLEEGSKRKGVINTLENNSEKFYHLRDELQVLLIDLDNSIYETFATLKK